MSQFFITAPVKLTLSHGLLLRRTCRFLPWQWLRPLLVLTVSPHREMARLSWPKWLVPQRHCSCAQPKVWAVTHPTNNRAQWRATSLIKSNASPLPSNHQPYDYWSRQRNFEFPTFENFTSQRSPSICKACSAVAGRMSQTDQLTLTSQCSNHNAPFNDKTNSDTWWLTANYNLRNPTAL